MKKFVALFLLQLSSAAAQSPTPICEIMTGYYGDDTCTSITSAGVSPQMYFGKIYDACIPIESAAQAGTQSYFNLPFTPVS